MDRGAHRAHGASVISPWGYCRIQGELKEIGHRVASTTIANVLEANRIKPARDRPSSWRVFLESHWGQVAATNFFSIEVWTAHGLMTYYVRFVVDLTTRRVHCAGMTPHAGSAFMARVARNLTDSVDGCLTGHRVLISDRDTKFTAQWREVAASRDLRVPAALPRRTCAPRNR